jgi:hypothetical protein
MKQQNNFNSGEEHEQIAQSQTTQNSMQEFSNVEALLRHDAQRTSPPGSIAERLQKSSAGIPKPPRSLWQRLFGQ